MSDRALLRRTCKEEVLHFFKIWDERFEAYQHGWPQCLARDMLAALVVALVAIPLSIGIAIASGMRPETGIVAGALAGIVGGLFGGSKYQVYGPTAAFIPIISGIVHKFDLPFLVLATFVAGVVIMVMGAARLGRFFTFVPHSVIVGFTMGIAATIVISQLANVLGETNPAGQHALDKLSYVPAMFVDAHAHALIIALFTFFFVRSMGKISVLIPGALIAMGISTFVANQIWHDHMIPVVSTLYGDIGGHLLRFTPPALGKFSVLDLIAPVFAIVFLGALESLLSSRMADRLAGNKTPYNPNKELFGQGVINCVVPLFNGYACTGALARTATNIKVGAVSPLSSIMIGISVLGMMMFGARYLSTVPMAFVGGLLIYVASNMVKGHEVKTVFKQGTLHVFLMSYTALVTLIADLSIAVISATVLYYTIKLVLKHETSHEELHGGSHEEHSAHGGNGNGNGTSGGATSEEIQHTLTGLQLSALAHCPDEAAHHERKANETVVPFSECPQCGHELNQPEAV